VKIILPAAKMKKLKENSPSWKTVEEWRHLAEMLPKITAWGGSRLLKPPVLRRLPAVLILRYTKQKKDMIMCQRNELPRTEWAGYQVFRKKNLAFDRKLIVLGVVYYPAIIGGKTEAAPEGRSISPPFEQKGLEQVNGEEKRLVSSDRYLSFNKRQNSKSQLPAW
jgi:hypothetical protein